MWRICFVMSLKFRNLNVWKSPTFVSEINFHWLASSFKVNNPFHHGKIQSSVFFFCVFVWTCFRDSLDLLAQKEPWVHSGKLDQGVIKEAAVTWWAFNEWLHFLFQFQLKVGIPHKHKHTQSPHKVQRGTPTCSLVLVLPVVRLVLVLSVVLLVLVLPNM